MTELQGLLQAIVEEPMAEVRWLVLADWLEEYDDPLRAELLRLHRKLLATSCDPDAHPGRAEWQDRIVELLGQGVQQCVPRGTVVLPGGLEMEFSFIPPGSFLMGSPEDEEDRSDDETRHQVTLTKGYWLGIYSVTQGQWQAVMGDNPSGFKGDNLPVEKVLWDNCEEFVKKLGEKTGKRFRLPTEAEWEYACRAGTTTPFHFGETISTDLANYDGNYISGYGRQGIYREKTMPVGSFPPNAWGLYDMHGNVWEWCSDGSGTYPPEVLKQLQNGNNEIASLDFHGALLT